MVVGDAQLPRCRGNALTRTPQSPEPPRLPKEFLFMLLWHEISDFMRSSDKGEKEEWNDLYYNRADAFSPFLKLMRQPLSLSVHAKDEHPLPPVPREEVPASDLPVR